MPTLTISVFRSCDAAPRKRSPYNLAGKVGKTVTVEAPDTVSHSDAAMCEAICTATGASGLSELARTGTDRLYWVDGVGDADVKYALVTID